MLDATAEMARGSLEVAENDASSALQHLRRAWTIWQELELPYEAARTRILIGIAAQHLGDHELAQLEFEAAQATFERLGAAADARRAMELLGRPHHAPGGLTEREVEVLRLVAAGKANRDIAHDLHISERTVARHLQNIFVKLGLSSRAAATAFAFKHDLV